MANDEILMTNQQTKNLTMIEKEKEKEEDEEQQQNEYDWVYEEHP